MALTKSRLVRELILLFEGLTELIATAVDAKSPYTGDHCKRVPALTMMIAEAACRAAEGPFKDFTLSADELYELRIAAMLHDCGKVATPVHIVDKAAKLQTIVDRIELIDTRFEILRRDKLNTLQREKLEALLGEEGISQLREMDREWSEYVRRVDADLQFLRACNYSREHMPAAMRKRVLEIAEKYVWVNRNQERKFILTANEVENLTITKGNLTERERALVNEHVDLTIRMLQSLPLPKKLRNLPVHAGAYHERMDGRGYPNGLTREQITVQGRIINLADAFEALTAADRPYKQARKISMALETLRSMKEDGQIDPDLFDLFVKEKLYLRYAELYLNASQIDTAKRRTGCHPKVTRISWARR